MVDIPVRDWVYMISECAVGVLSVVGNALVLLAIHRTPALQTVTNCFIGSLAAADLLVGIVIPPSTILSYRGLPKNFYGCIFLNSLVVLITNISILNLAAVALERFVAIRYPLHYPSLLTVRRTMWVVFVTWVLAVLLGLVPIMGWNQGAANFTTCAFLNVIGLDYMVYLVFFGVNIPPLVFMFVIYVYIYHTIRKLQRRAVSQVMVLPAAQRRAVRSQMKDVRGARSLAYVIILFAVCWLPLHVLNTISLYAPEKSASYEVLLVTIVLSHANSFVNPFLYAYGNSRFKLAMKGLLLCREAERRRDSDSFSIDIKSRGRSTTVNNGVVSGDASPANGNSPRDDATYGGRRQSQETRPAMFVASSDEIDLRPTTQTLDRASLGRVNSAFSDPDFPVTKIYRSGHKAVTWLDANDASLLLSASQANGNGGPADTNSQSFSPSQARDQRGNDVSANSTSGQEFPIPLPAAESLRAHQTASQTSRDSANSTLSPPTQQRRVFLAAWGHLEKVQPLYPEHPRDRNTPVQGITSGPGEDYSLSPVYEVMLSVMDACSDPDINMEHDATARGTHGVTHGQDVSDGQTVGVTHFSDRTQNVRTKAYTSSNSDSLPDVSDSHGAKTNLDTAQSASPLSANTLLGDRDKTKGNSSMSGSTEKGDTFISVRL